MYRNTFVEVDLSAIASNAQNIKTTFKDYEYFFAVLKGSAYGHGEYIVNTLVKNGVNYIAVSDIKEALAVREFNKTIPILCFIPINIEHLTLCTDKNITITIHDLGYAKKIASKKLSKKLKVHLKIDSGMSRLGFTDSRELADAFNALDSNKNIKIEGVYTHFATSGIYDHHYSNQIKRFLKVTNKIPLNNIPIVHADRSLTVMSHTKPPFANGMRIGISLYGYSQLPRQVSGVTGKLRLVKNKLKARLNGVERATLVTDLKLKPALSMFSEVIQVKNVLAGSLVGYGETVLKNDTTLAIVPAGYGDGIDLRRTNSYVLIGQNKYRIVGTVNMNSIIVEVDHKVKVGDKVEIIGSNISIREVSSHIGTTIYETMTSIPQYVPRVYTESGKPVHVIE